MLDVRQTIGLMLLTAAAFATWTLTRDNEPASERLVPLQPLTQGYYLKQARIFGTADDGELLYEIIAEEAEQLSDRSVSFSNVNIRYGAESGVPWRVDADNAVIDPEEPRIRLRGHVIASSEEGFDSNEVELRTNYLVLDPDRFVAETEERVQIRIGARSLTATGMIVELQKNELSLLANVRGTFAP